MPKMILIMGLPGSGKTTFAEKVVMEFHNREILATWFNADEIRQENNDWDFSDEGRLRQAMRMRELVDNSETEYNIVDMVAPTIKTRTLLKPDLMVHMNTIEKGRFEDTNQMFVKPKRVDLVLTEFGTERDAELLVDMIL